jgi:hypothetical protein
LTLTGECHPSIVDCISSLDHITYLGLKFGFNSITKKSIPKNVVCLAFNGVRFRINVSECIPENVIYLIIDNRYVMKGKTCYDINWDDMPSHIKSVTLCGRLLTRQKN